MSRTICLATLLLLAAWASPVCAGDSILINFTSQRCGPCRLMRPLLQTLENEGVPVRHVDVDREPALASRYGIRQTPTYVVMTEGREVTRMVGSQTAAQLRSALAMSVQGAITPTRSELPPLPIAAPRTRLAPIRRGAANPVGLGGAAQPWDAQPASVASPSQRPRSSEAMPSLATAEAVERAQAATVRLRVHDGKGYGAGTGTIIDTHGEEALVLTCGHLFRETGKEGRVEVDLFVAGQTQTVPGQVIDYDAEDRDVALVAIRPGFPVTPVPLTDNQTRPEVGSVVFSFGCDRGDDPSRRDTRITGVNKYNQHLNASNLEIGDAPIDGRSGGGLFDAAGRLIGVCNAADYRNNVGIYAGPGEIAWQLERVGMSRLMNGGNTGSPADLDVAPTPAPAAAPPERLASLSGLPSGIAPQPSAIAGHAASDQEVIVIIRDKSSGTDRVVTLSDPSAEFMQMLPH